MCLHFDEYTNVSCLLNHMRTQWTSWVIWLLAWWTWWISGLDHGLLWKIISDFGIIILICIFSYMCLCWCGICLQSSQRATKGATPMLVKPLADCSGPIVKEVCVCEIVKSQSWGVECWGRSSKRHNYQLTCELELDTQRLLTNPLLGMWVSLSFPIPRGHSKDLVLRLWCDIENTCMVYMTKPS